MAKVILIPSHPDPTDQYQMSEVMTRGDVDSTLFNAPATDNFRVRSAAIFFTAAVETLRSRQKNACCCYRYW